MSYNYRIQNLDMIVPTFKYMTINSLITKGSKDVYIG